MEGPLVRPNVEVITLDGVQKWFGGFCAVESADFSIQRGEFFSMLGPSGCGKTTTLRMIAGFESPTEGRILLAGVDVSHVPPYRRDVNTVFQQYALFPHMTVFDNVAYGLRSRRVPRDDLGARVKSILEIVRMGEFAGRFPSQLSGGQQQRVALARALVNRPAALLLDEPLAALDRALRQAMQLELKRIQRETAVTFVFVTHDQTEALTMSDRVAVMNKGRVEQIGTPAEIYHHPASAFVAGFIGEANLLPGTAAAAVNGDLSVSVSGISVPVDGRGAPQEGPVLVMVRPERVRVGRTEPPDGRGLPATVGAIVFRGPTVRIELAGPGGVALVANAIGVNEVDGLKPGEPVFVSWDRDAAFCVPAAVRPNNSSSPDGGAS